MASHKRVDSAADIVINNAAGHDLSTQIQPVQAFLDAARNLAALEGPSIVQALMGRVKELEDSLKASDDLLKGCKHFNRDLQTEIQDLTTLDKANKAKVSEFAREREQLQATKVEDDKKLQDLQSSKRELEARFGNLERQLKAEKETTTKLRDTLSKTTDTLETRTTEAQELRKSEQALNKRCSKADQEISHIRKLTTRLDDEDQHKMSVAHYSLSFSMIEMLTETGLKEWMYYGSI
jgi:chromosome segregation ATPase